MAEEKTTIKRRRERKTTKKRSIVDSAARIDGSRTERSL